MKHARIIGTGSYLPKEVQTNQHMEQLVETNDAWIQTRTGIKQRHRSDNIETTAMMGGEAAKKALAMAQCDVQDIDTIILATTTPDQVFPATAVKIQEYLGAKATCFDIQAVCSGFVYALTIADAFIQSDKAKKILVIGAERFTTLLDYTDRNTCILFGDGAGAVVVSATEEIGVGIRKTEIHTDSQYNHLLYCDRQSNVQMKGAEVFRHAVEKMGNAIISVLEEARVDWIVAHQANSRILEAIAERLKIPKEKFVMTLDTHANTSAASIPLALDTAVRDGRIKKGDSIVLTALGGGFVWGAIHLYW